MFKRNSLFAVWLWLAVCAAVFGQGNQGAGYLFQLSGPNSSGGQFFGFVANANPFNPVFTASGPAGVSKIVAKPDGSKFYVLGSSGSNALQSADPTFTRFTSINGLGALPTAIAMTPDGKYLLVGADALYVIDTNTDTILGSPIALPGIPVVGIAVSRDSKRAFVLTSGTPTSVTAYDLGTRQRVGTALNFPFSGATSITFSPLGLLYVTEVNRIYEIDPATLTVTPNGEYDLFFTPGPLRFTPDGAMALTVNKDPIGGGSILKLTVATHTVSIWPVTTTGTQPLFDDILVASNTRAFALWTATNMLYDISLSPLTAVPTTLSSVLPPGTNQNVLGAAVSSELPAARYLFLLIANGNQFTFYRIDLTTNTVSIQANAQSSLPLLQYLAVPAQTGASTFLTFNNLQTLAAGATSAPLIARVLDAQGRPVFNLPVTFTADPANPSTGAVISNPNAVTNAEGYVQTTVTLPAAPGMYTIRLTAGTSTTPFTLTIPGTGGGGGGGGNSQVNIVSGDGQLIQEFSFTPLTDPLTIRVTDTSGNPLPNIPVTFAVTAGTGLVGTTNVNTDSNGLASTNFLSQTAGPNSSFDANIVTASTSVGSANFTEVVYRTQPDGSGQPEANIITPTDYTVTAGQGTPVPNAITAQIRSGNFPNIGAPIPGVGIYIQNVIDPTLPPPAMCQGSTNADQGGVAHCTLIAGCTAGTGTFAMNIVIGSFRTFAGLVRITKGAPAAINIVAGNNQSGRSGQALTSLQATVTDGCNQPAAGAQVTWAVVQGSATLTNTVTTSDAQGRVSTGVTLGQTPGPVQVRVSLGTTAQATFQLTNQVVIAGVSVSSGNNQTAIVGQAFAQPVTFQVVDNQGNAVPGIVVTFAVSGGGTVSPATATTDATGKASTTVTAGSTAGNIVITATAGTATANATLTARPPGPVLTSTSFVNAASLIPGLVPCGLATAVGPGLAPGVSGIITPQSLFGPLPYTLSNLSISVNNIPAPIQAVSNQNGKEQVNFQTPCEVQPGAATVGVSVSGGSSTVTGVPVLQAQPGIFTYAGPNGIPYGAVIRAADGSYVTPSNPARRGETYYLVATGLGQTTPPAITNSAGVPGQTVNLQVVVGVNNVGVPVLTGQSTYLVGTIGVYLIAFQIPITAATGNNQPLALAVIINGQAVFGNPVFLPGVI